MDNKEILNKMTLEEKASLTTGKDFWQTENIDRLGISNMFLSDGPHGLRKQAGEADHIGLNPSLPATCFPTAATVANSWNTDLAEKIGTALGEEAASMNVSVLLGPGMCIKRNPLCGRNFEYFSEDPYLAGKLAASYVKGIQSKNVSACIKHFAANNQEERRMVIDTIIDERTLREIYLTAFEIAVKESGVYSVMSSYNKINGSFANENHHLLVDILRNEWKYNGIVVSDWGGDNDRVEALKCGADLEMPSTAGISNIEIINAIHEGKISEDLLDETVDRLLSLYHKTKNKKVVPFDIEKHHEIAKEAAEESVVLLKNEDNILPLSNTSKVAFIGDFVETPRYQGAGSSVVNPTKLDTTYNSLKQYDLSEIVYAKGYERNGKKNKKLINEACTVAKNADVAVLYLGLDETSEVEGLDRKDLKLPQNQIDLLQEVSKVTKNIVIVLSCGCVVEMPWLDCAKGLLHGYLSGQAGAGAMLDILFGKTNPSGKLAETYPVAYEDIPAASHFPGKEVSVEYREGIFIGYRYFATANKEVLFPFGYGLSYTTFEYSNLSATDKEVRVSVTNTGKRDGSEIVQLYVNKKDSKIFRAAEELKGFKKVYLAAGETKEIVISLDDKAFRYFNVKTNKWEIESGSYEIMVGASSSDIKLQTEIEVIGTDSTIPYDSTKLESYYTTKVLNVSDEQFENLLGYKPVDPKWDKTKVLGYNDTLNQLFYAKGAFGRFAYHCMKGVYRFCKITGNTNMVNQFDMSIYNMPFRGIVRMSGGIMDFAMLDGIMTIVNGHFFKGLKAFIKASNAKNKRDKEAANV